MKPLYGPKVPGQDARTAATGAALQQAMANAYRPAPNALAAVAQGLTPVAAAFAHKLTGDRVKGEQIDAYEQAFQQMNAQGLTGDAAMFSDPRAMAEMMVNTPDLGKMMMARQMRTPEMMSAGNDVLKVDPYTGEVELAYRAPFKPKTLTPQQEAFDRLTPEQQAQYFLKPNSTNNVQVYTGKDPGLNKTTSNKVEEKLLNTGDMLQRLNNIETGFDERWLRYDGQIQNWASNVWEKAGGTLSPDAKQDLEKFTSFRRDATENLVLILNALSGAAVTPEEYDRISSTLPNTEDGPTQFRSKLNAAKKASRMAMARYHYIRNNNSLNMTDISLDQMPRIMSKRSQKLINERLAALGVEASELNESETQQLRFDIKRQLADEFGLGVLE